ncbi:PhoP regulatory network YrbL family protein [Salinispirillum sp. LH 10-3-1]|uniref:PhoP regulatory network YrbL family protein n=1 Tax=Salinispirillum sp. LH 10-3-1 TaxID=2952525 RepID=A0AB38YJZ8_9GAMM
MKIPILALRDQAHVAKGTTRLIYEWPGDHSRLIKVHKRWQPSENDGAWVRWFKAHEDWFLFRTGILRELNVYLRTRYDDWQSLNEHIAPILGLVDTDLGLGFVITAVRDAQGGLAPTARQLLRSEQMTAERAVKLQALVSLIEDSPWVIGDLNLDNIVLSEAGLPHEKFMLIDGLGERTLLPVQHWLPWARQRQKKRFAAKVRRRLAKL